MSGRQEVGMNPRSSGTTASGPQYARHPKISMHNGHQPARPRHGTGAALDPRLPETVLTDQQC